MTKNTGEFPIKLFLFDVDGTLTQPFANNLTDEAVGWFDRERPKNIALITNQGGVGLRLWMEEGGFGNPSELPTQNDVIARLDTLKGEIMEYSKRVVNYVAYRYQSRKSGEWSPVANNTPEWSKEWRKPLPGMLLQAMEDFNALPAECIMVGDRESDRLAAEAAGVKFIWAINFFEEG